MHKQRWIMHTILFIGAAAVALGVGCGGGSFPLITSRLPTQLTGPDGQLITLQEIKANPKLENMMVARRGMRLSVQPVTAEEWTEVLSMGGLS